MTKKRPLTLASFDDFFASLPGCEDGELIWTVERAASEAAGYDLKAVNPNRRHVTDDRPPLEIVAEIEARGAEVAAAVARLRALLQS